MKLLIVLFFFVATPLYAQDSQEDFKTFLDKFTTSASFQYERVKFPLSNSIVLLNSDNEEQEIAFTREMWPLLDADAFLEERVEQEEGSVYVARFVLDEPDKKEFEAGYEESEIDLRVVFERTNNQWHVTDCYNGWYSFDLPAEELEATVKEVQSINQEFIREHP